MFDYQEDNGGGAADFYVSWKGRGNDITPPRSFEVRTRGEGGETVKKQFTVIQKGIILGIDVAGGEIRTGWVRSNGQGSAPTWVISDRLNDFSNHPEPEDLGRSQKAWSKGIQAKVAVVGKSTAHVGLIEDTSVGGLVGVQRLFPEIKRESTKRPGLLPVIRHNPEKDERGGSANRSFVIPGLEIVSWVERPECMRSDSAFDAADDHEGGGYGGAPAQRAGDAPQHPQADDMDDEIPF